MGDPGVRALRRQGQWDRYLERAGVMHYEGKGRGRVLAERGLWHYRGKGRGGG